MIQKNNITRRICCNAYMCLSNIQYKNKTPACLQYYFVQNSQTKKITVYKNVEVQK